MSRRLVGVTIALAGAIVGMTGGCGGRAASKDAGQVGGLAGLGGPTGSGGAGSGAGTGSGGAGTFVRTRDVDMVFVVDDATGMRQTQANLVSNFPQFMRALEGIPGGFPNVHIAVVSSDMGTGGGPIGACLGSGKAGAFQHAPLGPCTQTNLQPGATFISNDRGVANYTGPLEEVFACIAPLGEGGCGFAQPLAAVVRALGADGQPVPPENQGFLRPNAYLSIVMVTNKDDCSAPSGSALLGAPSTPMLASTFGPPQHFRCNEFGHVCAGVKPPRLAPTGSPADTVTLDGCEPAEAGGLLTPVATLVAQLRALKPFPDEQILVSTIIGPPAPYTVRWRTPTTNDSGPWPEVAPSCTAQNGTVAEPAVRLRAFADTFRVNGVAVSICDESFAPVLRRLADVLGWL